jgi:hypothetical protein
MYYDEEALMTNSSRDAEGMRGKLEASGSRLALCAVEKVEGGDCKNVEETCPVASCCSLNGKSIPARCNGEESECKV